MPQGARISSGYNDWFVVPGQLANAPNGFSWKVGPRSLYDPVTWVRGGDFTSGQPADPPVHPGLLGSRIRSFFDDYYNRIYVSPTQIDYGAITGDSPVNVRVWNAYYQRSVTLESLEYNSAAGLRVTGEEPPNTISPLGLVQYQVTALAQGPAQINEFVTWVFDTPWVFDMQVRGARAKAWEFAPSWPPTGRTYRVNYEFSTEIITSHSGKQQRIARRIFPRKSLEHQVLLYHDTFRRFKDMTRFGQHHTFLLPELPRFVESIARQPSGTSTMRLSSIPDWVQPDVTLWVTANGVVDVRIVESVDGDIVTFRTAALQTWPIGARVHPALSGNLATELSAPRVTNAVARLDLRFEVTPLSEPVTPVPAPDRVFNGREVFLKRPNWANPVNMRVGHETEILDFGKGPVSRFNPVEFGYETYQAVFLNRTAEEAEAMLDFFRRMRGQQGEFYMPTWEYDIVPAERVSALSFGIYVDDQDFATNYKDSTVYRAVFVLMNSGALILRQVANIEATETGALLTVTESWGVDFSAADIVMCGWMPVWRLASDSLTIEWMTNSVAQVTLNMVTLEDLPPETA